MSAGWWLLAGLSLIVGVQAGRWAWWLLRGRVRDVARGRAVRWRVWAALERADVRVTVVDLQWPAPRLVYLEAVDLSGVVWSQYLTRDGARDLADALLEAAERPRT